MRIVWIVLFLKKMFFRNAKQRDLRFCKWSQQSMEEERASRYSQGKTEDAGSLIRSIGFFEFISKTLSGSII